MDSFWCGYLIVQDGVFNIGVQGYKRKEKTSNRAAILVAQMDGQAGNPYGYLSSTNTLTVDQSCGYFSSTYGWGG